MAAANLAQAQAEAMKTAAGNSNGAMMGFMGMNMANQAGGMNANALYEMGAAQAQNGAPQAQGSAPQADGMQWFCPNCGNKNNGNFCINCGTKRP